MFKWLMSLLVLVTIASGCDNERSNSEQDAMGSASDVNPEASTADASACPTTVNLLDLMNGQEYTKVISGYPVFDFSSDIESPATSPEVFRMSVTAPCNIIIITKMGFQVTSSTPIHIVPKFQMRVDKKLIGGTFDEFMAGDVEPVYDMPMDWEGGVTLKGNDTPFDGKHLSITCPDCASVLEAKTVLTICLHRVEWMNHESAIHEYQTYATGVFPAVCITTEF